MFTHSIQHPTMKPPLFKIWSFYTNLARVFLIYKLSKFYKAFTVIIYKGKSRCWQKGLKHGDMLKLLYNYSTFWHVW